MIYTLIDHRNDTIKCSKLCSETTPLRLVVPLEFWTIYAVIIFPWSIRILSIWRLIIFCFSFERFDSRPQNEILVAGRPPLGFYNSIIHLLLKFGEPVAVAKKKWYGKIGTCCGGKCTQLVSNRKVSINILIACVAGGITDFPWSMR